MAQDLNLLYQRYRLIALAVYTAVLLAGVLDWVDGGIGPRSVVEAPEYLRFLVFVTMVLALIGLELWMVGKSSFAASDKIEPIPFSVKLILFTAACLVTDLHYSQILFLPILLYCYLAVSRRLSYCIALLGVIALFGLNAANIGHIRPLPPPLVNGNSPKMGGLVDRSTGSLITLLFTLLLAQAMSQAIQAQQKLTGLLTSLEASHKQLQHYSKHVADLAATEERNRLARDIHDSLGHHLAAINIQLAKASAYKERDPDRAYEAVKHAQHAVQDALRDVRESVSSLRQAGSSFSFQESLNDLIRRMDHSELDLSLNQTGDSLRYSRLKLMTLYRVIQEGLTNIHKHAGASQAHIALDFGSHDINLELTDNGSGFDSVAWESRENQQTTLGLIGLKERLSLVGGTLSITSRPQGTKLSVSIPQDNSQASFSTEK
ncbi:sensor histidine kinase [Acaryochloris sp. IP29b_bin.148]|uniref:sensor histidine kinase n=1 Tax=Acaryochloris sp. IP29b_bin.148 TaxID=2969218 RepID=UPI0026340FC2|nr:sensor histidine kinase [Acaryochloris sp. IP29b_bin.148]